MIFDQRPDPMAFDLMTHTHTPTRSLSVF